MLFVLLIILMLVVLFWPYRDRTGPLRLKLQALARRWNGRVHWGRLSAEPLFDLRIDGVPGEALFFADASAEWAGSRVDFNWPTAPRLRVIPEDLATRLKRTFGATDLALGDPEFDAAFWVESSDPAWARDLLNPEVRRGLLALRGHSRPFQKLHLSLDVGTHGITLRVSRVISRDIAAFEAFIEAAISVLRRVRALEPTEGVLLQAVQIVVGSGCPVCGQSAGELMTCPKCRTPHHGDCWKYFGGCSIYGCEGRGRKPAA
jgi:hypothetical protein